ncbi:MAG: LuxR C-terminal-related transcriptional regulator [Rhizobiaceae bacterium]
MANAETLFISDLLSALGGREADILSRLAARPEGIPLAEIPPATRKRLASRFRTTLVTDDEAGLLRPRSPDIGKLLARSFAAARTEPASDDATADDIPDRRDYHAFLDWLAGAQNRGDHATALEMLRRGGGYFFMHFFGMDVCQQVLDRFPEAMRGDSELLVLTATMHALKSGNTSRARHLITQRYGSNANDLRHVLDSRDRYSLEFRYFRFLMAMYEDVTITDKIRALAFDMLGEAPLDDHLKRGSFYNAFLEAIVRRREYDTADEIARRARYHYEQADAHLLCFYVVLYQSILSLLRGEMASAERHARQAVVTLEKVPFDTPSDTRLIGLVKAIIRYENGDIRTLVRFLNEELDRFAYGEIWPTVAELAINYGGLAISRHVAAAAARVFLDKWRVQEWRSNRFRLVILLREASVLQNSNRWREAADLLTTVQSRVNRTWVEGSGDNLVRLVDPQEIAVAMAWLRHLIWEVPNRPALRDQVAALLKNGHLTERQRITLLVWSAHLARQHRDITAARSDLLKALEASARLGTIMSLTEESPFLDRLADDKRIRAFVQASNDARQVLRRVRSIDTVVSGGPQRAGLTRQETRVLLLVVEGGTNKFVARQLGVSEVTVKFHLSNIFRKIGCRRRAEAIATAKALGWVE